jgi:periplasmic protein TonB
MKKTIIYLLLVFVSTQLCAQVTIDKINADSNITTSNRKNNIDKDTFTRVELEPEFPGGTAGWLKYLRVKLNGDVPKNNKAPVGRYLVIVTFIVDIDGSISQLTSKTNYGYGMENEVKKVIQTGPKWKAGIQNGKPVKSEKTQTIIFVVH